MAIPLLYVVLVLAIFVANLTTSAGAHHTRSTRNGGCDDGGI